MKLSVIIPVLNEQENVENLVSHLNVFFSGRQHYDAEVIFVNDGSKDLTAVKLRTGNHSSYAAKVINLSKNYGSHAALRAGIQHAEGDFITFIYADLQDPLDILDALVYEVEERHSEICWAHRASVKVSNTEKFFSKSYAYLMKKYAVPNFPDNGFDIVMFSRRVQECLNRNVEGNSSLFIQILDLGFKQTSVTYVKQPRILGKSKWTVQKKIKLLIDSFVAFSFAPIRLVSLVGITFFILGVIWTTYIVFRKIFFDDLVSGWPALISILMLGFGITNISLGIIAEYLWRTLDASRKRPVFVIDEVININNASMVQTTQQIKVS